MISVPKGDAEPALETSDALVAYVEIVDFRRLATPRRAEALESLARFLEDLIDASWGGSAPRPRLIAAGRGLAFVAEEASVDFSSVVTSVHREAELPLRVGLDAGPLQSVRVGAEETAFVGPAIDGAIELTVGTEAGDLAISREASAALAKVGLRIVPGIESVPPPSGAAKGLRGLAQAIRTKRAATSGHDLASVDSIHHRLKSLRRDILIGLGLIAGVFFAGPSIERSDVGRRLELATYDWLSGYAAASDKETPVAIVDFGENINVPSKGVAMPRTDLTKLQRVVDGVVALHPASVAIDLDFGPHARAEDPQSIAYIDEGTNFVPWALKRSRDAGVPIYLATTLPLPGSPALLSDPDAAPLAVHCYVPPDARTGEIYLLGPISKDGKRLDSISEAVSRDYAKANGIHPPEVSAFRTPFVETAEVEAADGAVKAALPGESYFVNYVGKSEIERNTVRVSKSGDLVCARPLSEAVRGKAVLIGSTTTANDRFASARSGYVPGLMLHALGVDSRLRTPLYKFSDGARVALDLATSLSVLGAIVWIRWRTLARRSELAEERVGFVFTLGVALTTVALGIVLIRWSQTVWTGFLLALVLTGLDPVIEKNVVSGLDLVHRVARGAFRGWFSEEKE